MHSASRSREERSSDSKVHGRTQGSREAQAAHGLAHNLWWCWNPTPSPCSAGSTPTSGRSRPQPGPPPRRAPPGAAASTGRRPGFLAHMDRSTRSSSTTCSSRPGSRASTARSSTCASPTSPPSSASTRASRSTPAASGVLAGDHLKSSDDLGLPLVGVGLMYREGYFRQYLNVDGWQQERYPENDFFNLPLIPETNDGRQRRCSSASPFPGREVDARIWRIQVGRVPLYLLDTNIPQNWPGGSRHHRPALRRRPRHAHPPGDDPGHRRHPRPAASGKSPTVCHMNEGHSAFCGLERIRLLMEEHGLDFADGARGGHRRAPCFTTHTPSRPATTSSRRS